MTQILRRDCLLHWARWSYVSPFGTTRRYIPQGTFFPKAHITCSLLTKLVWFRWLDDGLVFFFLRIYGPRLPLGTWTGKTKTYMSCSCHPHCFHQLDRAQFSSLLPHGTLVHCFNAWESMSLKRLYHFGSNALNGTRESFSVHVDVSDLATWSKV